MAITPNSLARGGNHIVNFPMTVGLTSSPEWWDEEDANVTATYVTDLSAESVPETHHEHAFKIVLGSSGAGKTFSQTITLAEHDFLFAGDVVSASVWVYQSSPGQEITFSLVGDSSGVLRSATTYVSENWTLLKIRGVTIGASDTEIVFQLSVDANDITYYVTMPNFHLGSEVLPFEQNPVILVTFDTAMGLLSADPTSNAEASLDLSASVHPLACGCFFTERIRFTGSGIGSQLRVKPEYESTALSANMTIEFTAGASGYSQGGDFFLPLGKDKLITYAPTDHTKLDLIQIGSYQAYLRWAY